MKYKSDQTIHELCVDSLYGRFSIPSEIVSRYIVSTYFYKINIRKEESKMRKYWK